MIKSSPLLIFYVLIIQITYGQNDTIISFLEKEVSNSIKKDAIELYSANLSNGSNDFKELQKKLTGVKIVGLGEVTHGSSEIFKMKHRFIRFLVENLDFNIFSIEGNMPEAYDINRYIRNSEESAKSVIGGMGFWTWYTYELKDLVEWFKNYRFENGEKVLFTGFDMQSPKGPVKELKKVLKGNALDTLFYLGRSIDSVKSNSRKGLNLLDFYSGKIDFLRNWIKINLEEGNEKSWALQNIRILEQITHNEDYRLRDYYMAENVAWIYKENPKSKIVLWAHNEHVKNSNKSMGYHLKEKYGDSYISIGFCFYEGEYTAAGNGGIKVYKAQKAYDGTYESVFNKVQVPYFILDLGDKEYLPKSLLFRKTGAIKFENEFAKTHLSKDYDYIVFIQKSSASELMNKERRTN